MWPARRPRHDRDELTSPAAAQSTVRVEKAQAKKAIADLSKKRNSEKFNEIREEANQR